jgi:hypothetical protein
VLSGGKLRSVKEFMWTNGKFGMIGCLFELKYLVGLETVKFLMSKVVHRRREGCSYT